MSHLSSRDRTTTHSDIGISSACRRAAYILGRCPIPQTCQVFFYFAKETGKEAEVGKFGKLIPHWVLWQRDENMDQNTSENLPGGCHFLVVRCKVCISARSEQSLSKELLQCYGFASLPTLGNPSLWVFVVLDLLRMCHVAVTPWDDPAAYGDMSASCSGS